MYARKVLHSITIISTKRKNVQQILSIPRTSEKEKLCLDLLTKQTLFYIYAEDSPSNQCSNESNSPKLCCVQYSPETSELKTHCNKEPSRSLSVQKE